MSIARHIPQDVAASMQIMPCDFFEENYATNTDRELLQVLHVQLK